MRRNIRRKRRSFFIRRLFLFCVFFIVVSIVSLPPLVLFGPFKNVKNIVVGSVMTSRHRQYVEYFLSPQQIEAILGRNKEALAHDVASKRLKFNNNHDSTIEVQEIKGKRFVGKALFIHDPTRVKMAVSQTIGETGEKTSEIARRLGAVAAINAGGFMDVRGKGNGGMPQGLVMHDGKLIYNEYMNPKSVVIALDKDGQLLVGHYTPKKLKEMDVVEAITFGPLLVENGEPTDLGDGGGGWGVAPGAAIGQRKDGTIMFVTIDGREVHSIGATIPQLQDVLLELGAYRAANLDGGSSTTMFYNGKVINQPSDVFGERYVPTAIVAMPEGRE